MKYEQTKDLKTPNYYQNEDGEDLFTQFKNGLITKDEFIGFLKGNAFKYLQRYDLKEQKSSDLYKLKDYVNNLVQFMIQYDDEYLKLVKHEFEQITADASDLFGRKSLVKSSILKYLKSINRSYINSMEEKKNLVLLTLLVDKLIDIELGVLNE